MYNYKNLSDPELIDLAREGDHIAFTQIYDRYWSVLYLHAKKMLNDEEEAKDIVQNLFYNLLQAIPTLNFQISLSAYLYRSVRNMVLDAIRHQQTAARYLESFNQTLQENHLITDDSVRERELERLIENEIKRLPKKMREVFLLSRKEHLSHKQISDRLGITEHTIKSQIGNAIKILRMKINVVLVVILYGYFF
ncbi:RNA polymerase sigma-70 factor [Pedobacter nutrimenti]|uniref:RNA polymerase sigma factor n=1 Tax=Pedobacter nutrimenti TaxID=1241337 RepID=UPI002930448B|nr:RNA polymerase sigma-70 factor [Pedobacter nutrimenti]